MKFTNQFVVNRPSAEVFAYLTDFDSIPDWNSEVQSSRTLTRGSVGKGTRFSQRRHLLGKLRGETLEVTDFVVDRRVSAATVGAATNLAFSWNVEELGDRTRLTSHISTKLPGRWRLIEPIAAPVARRRVAANMRRLQAILGDCPVSGRIDSLERVHLGETEQWILIRSADVSNPVLLVVGQGPGLPLINEANDLQVALHLEDDYTVVYLDQRGCGKSTQRPTDTRPITLELMVADTIELVDFLCRRLQRQRVLVLGVSQGGTVATLAAARQPDRISSLVTVGMDVNIAYAEKAAYDYVLSEAARLRSGRALRELRRIGPPPHLDTDKFGTRVRWLANFGGVMRGKKYRDIIGTTLRQLVTSRGYSPLEAVTTLRNIARVQNQMLPSLGDLDMPTMAPRVDVPIYMLQGAHDFAAPPDLAERYFKGLIAPAGKQFVSFEASAHYVHYEEPGKFREVLQRVRRDLERTDVAKVASSAMRA